MQYGGGAAQHHVLTMKCLDDATLTALLENELMADARHEVQSHLDGCPSCRELLVVLGRMMAGGTAARSELRTDVEWLGVIRATLVAERGADLRMAVRAALESTERVRSAERLVGTVLKEKWRLDALLGIGGMASVYAASHRNGHRVAIKMLHPALATSEGVRTRALREGYVANRVGHKGAVRVLDDDVEGEHVFLVMELLEGESLAVRARRLGGRMPLDEVLLMSEKVLDVLVAAHEGGIVHRDIKPENIFVTHDGEIRVLDFGIAKIKELSSVGSSATRTGSSMGTPAFMPPEQARGRWEEVDAQSDIWALGATMFTALTGHFVHEAATVNEQLLDAMTKPARSIREVLPALPQAAANVIQRALAFDKGERFLSALEMRDAVRALAGAGTGVAFPVTKTVKLEVPELQRPVPHVGSTLSNVEWRTFLRTRPNRGRSLVGMAVGVFLLLGAGGAVIRSQIQAPRLSTLKQATPSWKSSASPMTSQDLPAAAPSPAVAESSQGAPARAPAARTNPESLSASGAAPIPGTASALDDRILERRR